MMSTPHFDVLALLAHKATLESSCLNGMTDVTKRVTTTCQTQASMLRVEDRPKGLWFSLHVPGADEVGIRFRCAPDEGFMGFGEQFSHLNMAGRTFTLCVSEQGIGRGAQPLSWLVNLASKGAAGDAYTTYAPQPVCITTHGRALCFEQESIYWVDLSDSPRGQAQITVWGDTLSGYVFQADTPLALIEQHTAVTGRLKALPPFAYGAILGLRGGKEVVSGILEKCKAHNAAISALWIEDWQGRRGKNGGPPLWWRWYPDQSLYPDFRAWAQSLKDQGIALMGYANPFLSADESNPLYVEGREKRYFIRNADGSDLISHFFSGKEYTYVCVDLTNPEAYAWLKAKMRTGLLDSGLSGWMADYGEYAPIAGKSHEENAVRAHCATPVLWAKLNAELLDEQHRRGEVLAFHRSAGTFSNRYATAYWAGDQNPTLDRHDGLASAITALITSGISGMSINHTDVGGFTTLITPLYKLARKKEVMLRWLEFAAFTPIFRTHDGAYANPINYQFYYDDEGYTAFAKMTRLHAALGWYIQDLEKQAVERGHPMVRALYLHYPSDPEAAKIQHQYLFGEDLLVCPVIKLGARNVRAYVPGATWLSPYDRKPVPGSKWHTLPAPPGKPAVLVRDGSPHAERLLKTLAVLSE